MGEPMVLIFMASNPCMVCFHMLLVRLEVAAQKKHSARLLLDDGGMQAREGQTDRRVTGRR